MVRAAVLVALAGLGPALAACADDGGGEVCEGDVRTASQVYHGTAQPTYAPLTAGQVRAIGAWSSSAGGPIYCSGTLIAPTWALTADHCDVRVGEHFCLGTDASRPIGCLRAAEVHRRPQVAIGAATMALDLALVRLDGDGTELGAEPIPIAVDDLVPYRTQMAETAGFGETHDGVYGHRYFAVEMIDDVGGEHPAFLTVNGLGQRGVCWGDSGGPALVIDDNGAARVAGALSWGDASCVDRDRYTRVDHVVTWIEQFTGPTVAPVGAPCGALDAIGRCSGNRALWCEAGVVTAATCRDDTACGWDADRGGFRCLAGPDPCGGVDRIGRCDGSVARWCEEGTPRGRTCACLGQVCRVDPEMGGAYCADDPCMGLDFLGTCEGDVAVWCDGGALRRQDCGAIGRTCGWIDESIGYYCQ